MDKKDPTQNDSQLGNLLLRYKKIFKPPQQSVLEEVVRVVKEITFLDVTTSQFTYHVPSRTIYIKTPSLLRVEILRSKPVILKALRERLGEHHGPTELI